MKLGSNFTRVLSIILIISPAFVRDKQLKVCHIPNFRSPPCTNILLAFLNGTIVLVSPKTLNYEIENYVNFNWIYLKTNSLLSKVKNSKKSPVIVYLFSICLSLFLNIERASAFRVVSDSLFHALEARWRKEWNVVVLTAGGFSLA